MKLTFFISALPKKKGNCKYKPICSLYSKDSYTCTHTGGSYCGKYRKYREKPAKNNAEIDWYLTAT